MTGSDDERRTTLAQLATVVTEINRHGLAVLVTLLPPSLHHELPETYLDGLEGPKFRAYADRVEHVARALAAIPSAHGGARADERAAIAMPGRVRHRLERLSAGHDRAHPPHLGAIATVPHRRLLVEYRGPGRSRYRSASRSAQFRQHPFLLSVPVHASGRELDRALSRRHDRRALSGLGGRRRQDARSDAAAPADHAAPGQCRSRRRAEKVRGGDRKVFCARIRGLSRSKNGWIAWRIGSSVNACRRAASFSPSSAP